jgi:hypothetical protein
MNKTVRWITRTALLLAIAFLFQNLRLPAPYGQVITGSMVNAVLVLAVTVVDLWSGMVIGTLTPWLALVTGTMGLPFMVPFIIIANLTLVITYGLLRRHSRFFAGVTGSLAKYQFFILTTQLLLGMIGKTLPPPAIPMFGITQLGTALIGTFLAFIIADTLQPYLNRSS